MNRSMATRTIAHTIMMVTAVLGVFGDVHARQACASAEHRQFDFWIGAWEVQDTSGTVLGHNTIERILGGCVLHESWRSARNPAGNGHSYNIYDGPTKRWHQTWVDASGSLLQIDGGLNAEGHMVMEGVTRDSAGRPILNRITWSPQPGEGLRQVWHTSSDNGATWTAIFDGYYRRVKGAGATGGEEGS